MRRLAVGLMLSGLAARADVTVRAEAGAAAVVNEPQRAYYLPGPEVAATVAWGPVSVFDLTLGAGYAFFPRGMTSPLKGPGAAFRVMLGARVHPPPAALLPFAGLSGGLVPTGTLVRAGLLAEAGLLFRVGGVLLGPRLSYLHVFKTEPVAAFPVGDASVLSLGLAVEFAVLSPAPTAPVPLTPPEPTPAPHAPATVKEPDTDADGVPDAADACPEVRGLVEEKGCPRYRRVVVTEKRIEINEKIFFAFGLTTILTRSAPVLDEVVQALRDRPNLCVRVEGHTDNVGKADANLRLSEGRAAAVRDYLVDHGIPGNALVSRGFGPSMPLQSNATPDGRERNRRVEFLIIPCAEVP